MFNAFLELVLPCACQCAAAVSMDRIVIFLVQCRSVIVAYLLSTYSIVDLSVPKTPDL